MFVANTCTHIDCTQVALDGSELCPNHHPDPDGYNSSLKDSLLNASGIIENRNWSGIDFSNMDLSGKHFRFCRFTGTCLSHAILNGAQFYMCMLDGVNAANARFTEARMESSIAVGGNFSNAILQAPIWLTPISMVLLAVPVFLMRPILNPAAL